MVQGHERLNPCFPKCLEDASVESHPFGIQRSHTHRLQPRPRQGKWVRSETEFGHQRDVLLPQFEVVTRNVAVVAVVHTSGLVSNVSQIEGPRPPRSTPPSIWYAAVAAPHRKGAANGTTLLF